MRKIALLSTILGGILAIVSNLSPAQAQATRTWVSGVGDDANPCSRTAPCKTFAGAISKTAGGGEINVLDPGGFGGVTITKSMTIRSTFEAGLLVSGTNAIVIAATANDQVILEGLDIEGLGTGLNGITVTGAIKKVYVNRCWINGFTQNGINMASTTSGARMIVKDTFITKNNVGMNVSGPSNVGTLLDTVIDGNTLTSYQLNGAGVIGSATRSTLNGATNAITTAGGALAISFGPSNLVSGAGAFSNTLAFQ